jgi:hypothetical protein
VESVGWKELEEAIEEGPQRQASPVTPENPTRPSTPETPAPLQTPRRVTLAMSSEAGPSTASHITYNLSDDQLAQLLHQKSGPTGASNPKVKDPELYYGDRAKLRSFISQYELKFQVEKARFDDDAIKIHFACSFCRGNAWAWVEPTLKKGVSIYKAWDDFRKAISKAFGEANSREVARRKLKELKQGSRSASAYWADFQRITADLDYNDAMYIDQFQDGLHLDVQRQLALLDEKPTEITEFANKAIG